MREVDHMPMIEPTTADAFTPKFTTLLRASWTASASDESPDCPAGNVLDGDPVTFWHSTYAPTGSPLPHSITIDMHATMDVSGLTYLPRQDGSPNGTIGRYVITTSIDGTTWSSAVATGTWNDDAREKVVVFPPVSVRFVRLTAFTEAGSRGAWSSAAELSLIGDPPAGPALPRTGWTATASDAATSHPPGNVLDGNAATMWHTAFSPKPAPLPHSLTLDLRTSSVVTGLTYLPRQDTSLDGTIGRYSVTVSPDGSTWGEPMTTGTWADAKTMKTASA